MGSPVARYYRELVEELRERTEGIEWNVRMLTLRGKRERIIEAYNPETEEGIGIAIDKKERDREKIIDTILANAQSLLPSDLVKEVIEEQKKRR